MHIACTQAEPEMHIACTQAEMHIACTQAEPRNAYCMHLGRTRNAYCMHPGRNAYRHAPRQKCIQACILQVLCTLAPRHVCTQVDMHTGMHIACTHDRAHVAHTREHPQICMHDHATHSLAYTQSFMNTHMHIERVHACTLHASAHMRAWAHIAHYLHMDKHVNMHTHHLHIARKHPWAHAPHTTHKQTSVLLRMHTSILIARMYIHMHEHT